MLIDYLGHSGFFAETDTALLLFDYYRGDLSPFENRSPDKPLFVFVSHAHSDHFNPRIFSLQKKRKQIRYLLAFDLKANKAIPDDAAVTFLEADSRYPVEDLGIVETFLSTDEGVAYLVHTPNETLFHAGDLHWWDWEGEDPGWLFEQETGFKRQIEKLRGSRPDAAFLVLDDRLEQNFAEGMTWVLSVCSPKNVFPMHFWKDRSVIQRFQSLCPEICARVTVHDTAHQSHWEI